MNKVIKECIVYGLVAAGLLAFAYGMYGWGMNNNKIYLNGSNRLEKKVESSFRV